MSWRLVLWLGSLWLALNILAALTWIALLELRRARSRRRRWQITAQMSLLTGVGTVSSAALPGPDR